MRAVLTSPLARYKQNPLHETLADKRGFPCICYAGLLCNRPSVSLPRAKRP